MTRTEEDITISGNTVVLKYICHKCNIEFEVTALNLPNYGLQSVKESEEPTCFDCFFEEEVLECY